MYMVERETAFYPCFGEKRDSIQAGRKRTLPPGFEAESQVLQTFACDPATLSDASRKQVAPRPRLDMTSLARSRPHDRTSR